MYYWRKNGKYIQCFVYIFKHLYLLTCLLLLFTKFCNINNVDKSKNPGLLRNKPKKELGLIKAKIGLYWTDALDF